MVCPKATKALVTAARFGCRAGLLCNSRVEITDSKGTEETAEAEADPM
jgi:hypothetical protein